MFWAPTNLTFQVWYWYLYLCACVDCKTPDSTSPIYQALVTDSMPAVKPLRPVWQSQPSSFPGDYLIGLDWLNQTIPHLLDYYPHSTDQIPTLKTPAMSPSQVTSRVFALLTLFGPMGLPGAPVHGSTLHAPSAAPAEGRDADTGSIAGSKASQKAQPSAIRRSTIFMLLSVCKWLSPYMSALKL